MGSFFSADNPLIRFLNRVCDILVLHVLWLVCSLPVFTIGASTTALYYTAMKNIKLEDGYVARRFFKSFKQNFKQSTIMWLLSLLALTVFGLDLYLCIEYKMKPLIVVFTVILCVCVFTISYIFPLQSKFDNPIKVTIRNAFLLSIKYFPWTLLLLFIFAFTCYLIYYSLVFAFIMLCSGAGLYAYGTAFIYNKLFAPYLPEERDIHDEENQSPDEEAPDKDDN